MALVKDQLVTVIPGVPGTPGRPATQECTPIPPQPPTDPPPPPPDPEEGRIYLYDNAGTPSTRTPWTAPAPSGYVCFVGTYLVFINGLGYCPVYETRCYAPPP